MLDLVQSMITRTALATFESRHKEFEVVAIGFRDRLSALNLNRQPAQTVR